MNSMVKQMAGLLRHVTTRRRKYAVAVVPDAKVFGSVFAANAKTARKNLERFAPRM